MGEQIILVQKKQKNKKPTADYKNKLYARVKEQDPRKSSVSDHKKLPGIFKESFLKFHLKKNCTMYKL